MSSKDSVLKRLAAKASKEEGKKDSYRGGYRDKCRELGEHPLSSDNAGKVYAEVRNPLKERYSKREKGEIAALAIAYLRSFARDFGHRIYPRSNQVVYHCMTLLERVGLDREDVPWRFIGEILENRLRVAGSEDEGKGIREDQTLAAGELRGYILKKAGMGE